MIVAFFPWNERETGNRFLSCQPRSALKEFTLNVQKDDVQRKIVEQNMRVSIGRQ